MKYALTSPQPLRTQAVHEGNRQTLLTDAPTDNGGLGEAFSPTDLVAVGLASCIMTILGLRAASRGLVIQGMEASTEKKMSPNPRRIARVGVEGYDRAQLLRPMLMRRAVAQRLKCFMEM